MLESEIINNTTNITTSTKSKVVNCFFKNQALMSQHSAWFILYNHYKDVI